MTKTNYALITALYDTKGADLYNDVYFPIIKYEIVNQYYTVSDCSTTSCVFDFLLRCTPL